MHELPSTRLFPRNGVRAPRRRDPKTLRVRQLLHLGEPQDRTGLTALDSPHCLTALPQLFAFTNVKYRVGVVLYYQDLSQVRWRLVCKQGTISD
jgi:hypothetical protein